jgi:hypothetical protein
MVFDSFMVVQSRTPIFQKNCFIRRDLVIPVDYVATENREYCWLMLGDFTITYVKEPRKLTHWIHAF